MSKYFQASTHSPREGNAVTDMPLARFASFKHLDDSTFELLIDTQKNLADLSVPIEGPEIRRMVLGRFELPTLTSFEFVCPTHIAAMSEVLKASNSMESLQSLSIYCPRKRHTAPVPPGLVSTAWFVNGFKRPLVRSISKLVLTSINLGSVIAREDPGLLAGIRSLTIQHCTNAVWMLNILACAAHRSEPMCLKEVVYSTIKEDRMIGLNQLALLLLPLRA